MDLKKKGFIFTMLSVVVMSVIFVVYISSSRNEAKQSEYSESAKIRVISEYHSDLINNYIRQVFISATYSSFEAMFEYMNLTGQPLNLNQVFSELSVYGRIPWDIRWQNTNQDVCFKAWLKNATALDESSVSGAQPIFFGNQTLVAQSFAIDNHYLDYIQVQLVENMPGLDVIMEIREDNAGSPTGPIIAKYVYPSPITANDWYSFNFDSLSLIPHTAYWFILNSSYSESNSSYSVFVDSPGTYANGHLSIINTTINPLTADSNFRVFSHKGVISQTEDPCACSSYINFGGDIVLTQSFNVTEALPAYKINVTFNKIAKNNITLRIERALQNPSAQNASSGKAIFEKDFVLSTAGPFPREVEFAISTSNLEKGKIHHIVLLNTNATTGDFQACISSIPFSSGSAWTGNLSKSSSVHFWVEIDKLIGKDIMKNATLYDLVRRMEFFSYQTLGISTNISFIGVTINQTDPWTVDVMARVAITNLKSGVTFNYDENVTVKVSIEGLSDPLFIFNGTRRKIYQSNFDGWNETNAFEHLQNGTYRFSEYAPSFLMRVANETWKNSSCCGIESMVNFTEDVNVSYIDYLYWSRRQSCDDGSDLWTVQGIAAVYPSFKLDTSHIGFYNVTKLAKVCNGT